MDALDVEPDYVLADYFAIPGLRQPQESIVDGDDLSVTIAAASIVAKVTYDRIMATYAQEYPGYGFAENKGALDRLVALADTPAFCFTGHPAVAGAQYGRRFRALDRGVWSPFGHHATRESVTLLDSQ